jgi:hypothetical protein
MQVNFLYYNSLSEAPAINRSFAIMVANFFGFRDCGPSEEARSGSG